MKGNSFALLLVLLRAKISMGPRMLCARDATNTTSNKKEKMNFFYYF